jgi:hypothetical protein
VEALKPDDAARWKELRRAPFALAGTPLELVSLTYEGEGAAVVVMTGGEGGRQVVGSYAVVHGGNGAEIAVATPIVDPSGPAAFALLTITRRFRGFLDGEKEVPGTDEISFAVLGFAADRTWLAADEQTDLAAASLQMAGAQLRLLECLPRKKKPRTVMALDPATARLEATIARDAVCGGK